MQYNPQERGINLYKAPEIKHCITCGQPLTPEVKAITNHMNEYLNPITGNSVGVVNSNDNSIVIQGVTVYKVTGKDQNNKPVSKYCLVSGQVIKDEGQGMLPFLESVKEYEPKPIANPVAPSDTVVVTRPVSRLQAAQIASEPIKVV